MSTNENDIITLLQTLKENTARDKEQMEKLGDIEPKLEVNKPVAKPQMMTYLIGSRLVSTVSKSWSSLRVSWVAINLCYCLVVQAWVRQSYCKRLPRD